MSNYTPIANALFGNEWRELLAVFQLHYGNRPGCEDKITATGKMRIKQSPLMRPFAFLFRWSKTLVPISETDVSAKVVFRTRSDSPCFWYDRSFVLKSGRVMRFVSRMEPKGGNEVVEWTASGIGWHSSYDLEDGRVRLRHKGYRIRLGGRDLKLPLEWLFGRPSAWEEATSDTAFRMEMTITHPLFGLLYGYAGQFEITEVALEK